MSKQNVALYCFLLTGNLYFMIQQKASVQSRGWSETQGMQTWYSEWKLWCILCMYMSVCVLTTMMPCFDSATSQIYYHYTLIGSSSLHRLVKNLSYIKHETCSEVCSVTGGLGNDELGQPPSSFCLEKNKKGSNLFSHLFACINI